MKKLMCAALLTTALAMPAEAAQRYACTVSKFVSTDDDREFARKNKRKTFVLTVSRRKIISDVRSKDFRDSSQTYRIKQRSASHQFGQTKGGSSRKTIVIPLDPDQTIAQSGAFKATVAIEGNTFKNSWHLRCGS